MSEATQRERVEGATQPPLIELAGVEKVYRMGKVDYRALRGVDLSIVALGTSPRWLAVTGYAIAVVLLVTAGFFPWIELLFPAWVLALSLHILVASFRRDRGERSTARDSD